uniref:M23 family metallopeptidase n=1 Tax=candidate division WOR-3 bacterium TaxID=2052148 RepID=A0A7C2K3G1_UNCW3
MKALKVIISIAVLTILVESANAFVWPTSGTITSVVGWRRHPVTGQWSYHYGTDIAAPSGRGVGNAGRGRVTVAGWVSGYGNAIYVDHSYYSAGWETRYAHLSAIYVRVGQWLTQFNQTIGAVGSTGVSTGPHLHWELRKYGVAQKPNGSVGQYVTRGTFCGI